MSKKIEKSSSVEAKISELKELIESSLEQGKQEEYIFQVQEVENGMVVEAENLAVHVRDDRTAAITVSGLSLEDSYLTTLQAARNIHGKLKCMVIKKLIAYQPRVGLLTQEQKK